ncbi:MAG TPA: ABC transporter substrate-binding protein [Chloroflexota bacterium]|nr:ABC transporter substrate-binding protein [Chloroflexota bacterium]
MGLLLPSCGGAAAGVPASAATASQSEAPRPGGRVIWGTASDAKTLTPVLSTDNVSTYLIDLIYQPLVNINAKTGAPEPGLAEKFELSADGKTMNLVLRDGLKWSDGSAFSGEDFKFTAEAVMRSKKTVRKEVFQDIAGAKEFADGKAAEISGIVVNGRNITVALEKTLCAAPNRIGGFSVIPKSVFGKYMAGSDGSKNVDDAAENNAPPLATGPFKFKDWKPNDHITLVRNDSFYGGRANLDEFVNKVVPDSNALAAALKTGEIDIADAADPKDAEDLKKVDSLASQFYLTPSYTYIGWNQLRGGKEFFQDKAVRQALGYGLNMDAIVDKVYFTLGQKALSPIPSVSWAYDAAGLNDYKYDPKKAQQLLEQAGWSKGSDGIYQKAGQKLSFSIVTNSDNKARSTFAQVAAEQYKQLGIDANLQTESFQALVDRINNSKDPKYGDQGGRNFDAVILGWTGGADPDSEFAIWHSSQIPQPKFNAIGYKSDIVDKALEDGRSGKCDQASRKAAYRAFSKQVNEDQPYNFGLFIKTPLFYSKRLQGIDPGPFPSRDPGVQWNVEKWWVN